MRFFFSLCTACTPNSASPSAGHVVTLALSYTSPASPESVSSATDGITVFRSHPYRIFCFTSEYPDTRSRCSSPLSMHRRLQESGVNVCLWTLHRQETWQSRATEAKKNWNGSIWHAYIHTKWRLDNHVGGMRRMSYLALHHAPVAYG